MTNNEQLMLNILKKVPSAISILPKKLKNNPNFMLEVIKVDSNYCLFYASEELKNNPNFMLEAIKIRFSCIIGASKKLQNDSSFMLEAIKINSLCLYLCNSDELKNNPNFMLEAIKVDSACICYASEELKNNPNFMLEAIKIDYHCIDYASKELRNNPEFEAKVIEVSPELYYRRNVRNNESIKNGSTVEYEEYKEKYKTKLQDNPQLVYQIPDFLYNDSNFMMDVARINPDVINIAPTNLQDNIQFVAACENAKINKIKEARAKRTGELSYQDKMLDYIENLQIQLLDERRKNLILKSQTINMQNNFVQPLEEMGGINHGQR